MGRGVSRISESTGLYIHQSWISMAQTCSNNSIRFYVYVSILDLFIISSSHIVIFGTWQYIPLFNSPPFEYPVSIPRPPLTSSVGMIRNPQKNRQKTCSKALTSQTWMCESCLHKKETQETQISWRGESAFGLLGVYTIDLLYCAWACVIIYSNVPVCCSSMFRKCCIYFFHLLTQLFQRQSSWPPHSTSSQRRSYQPVNTLIHGLL